jgi:hypothetical protein
MWSMRPSTPGKGMRATTRKAWLLVAGWLDTLARGAATHRYIANATAAAQ